MTKFLDSFLTIALKFSKFHKIKELVMYHPINKYYEHDSMSKDI